jgi:hypothetical protein
MRNKYLNPLLALLAILWLAPFNKVNAQDIFMSNGTVTACDVNFYDSGGPTGNYLSNENFTLTIAPANANTAIAVIFSSFQIENGWEFFTIYNGPTTADPLVGTYTGANSPGTILSTHPDGALTFVFTSDGIINQAGWEAFVTCISTVGPPVCANTVSPLNASTEISINADLIWSVGLGPIPTGYDVYFGTDPNPPLVASNFAGTTYDPGTLALNTTYYYQIIPVNADGSAAGCPVVSFTTELFQGINMTNGSVNTCSAIFHDSGGPFAAYQNNENLTFTIFPDVAGNYIQAVFTAFQTENNWDGLLIYNGPDATYPLIPSGLPAGFFAPANSFYGPNSPGTIISTDPSGALTFVFTSDGSVTNPGWSAEISCLTSVPVPNCVVNAQPFDGAVNQLTNTQLTWQAGPGAPASGFDVYFGTDPNPPLVSTNQQTTTYNPGSLALNTTYYWQVVPSNVSGPAVGCPVQSFTTVPNLVINMTNGTFTTCDAAFFDSGGPFANYSNGENNTLTIFPDVAGNFLQVVFNSFQTENGWDGLMIYNGPDATFPLIPSGLPAGFGGGLTAPANSFYGPNSPGTIISTDPSGALTFVFTSDGSVTNPGWDATVSCLTSVPVPPCVVNAAPFDGATAVLTTTQLTWQAGPGAPASGYDVYFGTDPNPPLVSANQQGTSFNPGQLALNTTYYWQVIPSNISGQAVGCPVQSFTTVANLIINMTNAQVTTCDAQFFDSGGQFANYGSNENFTLTIFPDNPGDFVNVLFTSFQTENNFDGLLIFDGPDATFPLIPSGLPAGFTAPENSFYGAVSPGSVTSSDASGALTFVFNSDPSVTNPGWEAIVSCVSPTSIPTCAINTQPANGAINVSVFAQLTWNNGPGIVPTGFDVYFGTDPNPPLVSANQPANSYNPGALALNTTYYYQIVPLNANGEAAGCIVNSFTTQSVVSFNMSNGTITSCNAMFYDQGGIGANYANGLNQTLTIFPDNPGDFVNVNFLSFAIENGWDFLSIYDGVDPSAPLIGTFTGPNSPGNVTANNVDGALTFVFTSDAIVNAVGWEAEISCVSVTSVPNCANGLAPIDLSSGVNPFVVLTWIPGGGVAPTGYDVYFGTDPNPPLVSANQAGISYDPGPLAFNTTYYWQIIPVNANGPAVGCNILSFTTAGSVVYCDAGATICDEFISNVDVAGMTNPTGCGLVGGYSDYTSISIDMNQSLSYPITVNNGPPTYAGDQCGVWIDWNQDGDFYDAGEQIIMGGSPGVGPYNGLITVPPTALLGTTRMRIRITWTGIVDPCGITTYGEVEDYTINVLPEPLCPYPGGLTATNITPTTADLNWNAVTNALSYNVRYKLVSEPNTVLTWTNPIVVAAPTTTTSISGLDPSSQYEFQVESECAPPDVSGYSFSAIFNTQCGNTVCPAGAIAEPEACGADANGGCNMPVPAYTPIACGETVCGTSWADGNFRDTDWFEFTITQPSTVTWTVDADFTSLIGFVDASQGCAAPVFFNLALSGAECAQAVTFDNLAPGTWWVFVAPSVFNGYPCGSGKNNYVATLSCVPLVTAPNDDCFGATMLTQNAVCIPVTDSVDFATQSLAGCTGTANDDVWFSFVATTTNPVVEVLGSPGFDAVIQVFDACFGNSLACVDQTLAGQPEQAFLTGLTIGNTYYVRVYDWFVGQPATTTFEICVYDVPPPPVNDDCSGAIPVVCGQQITGSTVQATIDAAPFCGTGITAPGLWYTVIGDGNPITANTCAGSSYDTKLNVYEGSCGNFICVGGNDDACGLQSSVTWNSVAGTTYYILVQGFGGQTGFFTLDVILQGSTQPVSIIANGLTSFCQGGSVELEASSANAVWSNGQQGQTINVTTAGDYFASVSDANGCSSQSNTITVTTFPGSIIPTITSPNGTVFCFGTVTELISSEATGNVWNDGSTDNSLTITTGGTYTVSVTDANGCVGSDAITITYLPQPVSPVITSSGTGDICPDEVEVLSAPASASYLWSNGETTQDIVVSSAACYNVTVTDADGCTAASADYCLNVLSAPIPVINPNGNVNICGGGSVDLESTPANDYLWSTQESTQVINVSTAGDYWVKVEYANGCMANSDTVTVSFFPAPVTPVITPSGPTTFCQGDSVSLSSSQAVSYDWVGTTSTTQDVVINTSGVYSVIITDANGCTAQSADITVTVNAAPQASITSNGPTTFCQGGAVVLTSSSATGNVWTPNGETTATITVFDSGNYDVVVTGANGCSATSNTISVNVLPAPQAAISASSTAICNNNSVTLTATPAGLTYDWSNPALTGQVVSVNQPGTYFVTVTGANGCSATSSTVTITQGVAQTPFIVVGGPTIICEGESVVLLSSAITGNVWNTGATSESITVTETGNYFVTFTDANGCSATSNPVPVVVNPLPTAGFTWVATPGGLTQFTNTSTDFNSSLWNFGDNSAFSNNTNPTYTYLNDGTYTVTLTVFNNCGSVTINQQVAIIGTSVEELANGGTINMYPNPTSGQLTVEINTPGAEQVQIRIVNLSGQLVMEDNLGQIAGNVRNVYDLGQYASGVYFLQIVTQDRVITRKVIRE